MDCVDGLNLTDYTTATGDSVQPKNFLFTSRISKNRIPTFLANKELVVHLTDKYSTSIIQQKNVNKLNINKLKRVIFSNVSLIIPNDILENILDELRVTRGSPITVLRATVTKDDYNHVGSHRRQEHVKSKDAKKFP